MLRAAAATPRKKFPPPTTNPICTPLRATSAISSASAATRAASMPNDPWPAITSPLNLRRTRWYIFLKKSGFGGHFRAGIAHFESHETPDGNVLTELGDFRFDQVVNGRRRLLDEGLLVKAHLFIELIEPSFDDLVHHFFRLA